MENKDLTVNISGRTAMNAARMKSSDIIIFRLLHLSMMLPAHPFVIKTAAYLIK